MTAPMNPGIADALVQIFAKGAARRLARANTALATLHPYERRLVREAAVMGYVLGYGAGRLDGVQNRSQAEIKAAWPKDSAVLQDVIEHCDSTSDLYPYLAAACGGRRRRVTKSRRWPGEVAD